MSQQPTDSLQLTVDDRDVPAAGTYTIDPAHTSVEFIARHLMISNVRGRFRDVSGTITIAEMPEQSHTAVELQAASVDTGIEARDGHLRSPDFFDTDRYPTIRFVSTAVEGTSSAGWTMDGDLTIRDVTRRVSLAVTFEGKHPSAAGDRVAFTATGQIDRADWGLTWNEAVDAGGVLIGKKIRLDINVQAVALVWA